LPPHVFAVAARAYRLMNDERRNQSILISGESGMFISLLSSPSPPPRRLLHGFDINLKTSFSP
jgi:hypothetical protein